MYYLGIDAGGTKTAFTLCDSKGSIIKECFLGSCYFSAIGEKAVSELLKEGFEHCASGIPSKNIYAFCGIPQYGELESVDNGLENIKRNIGFKIEFGNDVTCAAAGSLMFRPGIHLIAGTGSNAQGCDKNGNIARAGGWGFEIHGDEGSAYDLAIEMFHEFTKQSDHRHPRTPMYDALREKLSLNSDFDICRYLLEDIELDRKKIASFAPLCAELADAGDSACLEIFERAAEELCLIANGIKNRLDFSDGADVSYSGGVFKSGDVILKPLAKKLTAAQMTLCAPYAEPVIGSVLLAARLAGEPDIELMKKNLRTAK